MDFKPWSHFLLHRLQFNVGLCEHGDERPVPTQSRVFLYLLKKRFDCPRKVLDKIFIFLFIYLKVFIILLMIKYN
jgi:hypothetical protein